MSELTRCNYCQLLSINARAKIKRLVVTKQGDTAPGGTFPNGVTILMSPRGVVPDRNVHFVAWFADLTTRCAC
jgi:hypothetical protein